MEYYVLDLRDVDKINFIVDRRIDFGEIGELDVFKIVFKRAGRRRFKLLPILDRIIIVGGKRDLARFLAYIIKTIRIYDSELYKMLIEELKDVDYDVFYETYKAPKTSKDGDLGDLFDLFEKQPPI